jgi:hypothetical protein
MVTTLIPVGAKKALHLKVLENSTSTQELLLLLKDEGAGWLCPP